MLAHGTAVNLGSENGLGGRAYPSRAVVVDVALGNIQSHLGSCMVEAAFDDQNIIGGNGRGLVQAVIADSPAFQLQIILSIAVLDQQRSVDNTDRNGLAVTDQLDVVNAGLGIFDAPAVIGSVVCIHFEIDAVAAHAVGMGLHHATFYGGGQSGHLSRELCIAAVEVDIALADIDRCLGCFIVEAAIDDINIAVLCRLIFAHCPAIDVHIHLGSAVFYQSTAANDRYIDRFAVTDALNSTGRQRIVLKCPVTVAVGRIALSVCHINTAGSPVVIGIGVCGQAAQIIGGRHNRLSGGNLNIGSVVVDIGSVDLNNIACPILEAAFNNQVIICLNGKQIATDAFCC